MNDDQVPIERVDPQDVLERLSRLPIGTWRYRWEGRASRHVGPLARDFAAAFGVRGDDRTIDPQDATGVALAGVQALNDRIEQVIDRLARLEAGGHDVGGEEPTDISHDRQHGPASPTTASPEPLRKDGGPG